MSLIASNQGSLLGSQFSAIFVEKKIVFYSKKPCCDPIFANLAEVLAKPAQFYRQFFGENILKMTTSVTLLISPR
jgi:hypothetical protein